ncbi:hypothetical protein, partial [Escherichia coli]|uniref:hypothetical protein n=1 Tax=Escherichia coli TaxID=562 RepID=UPI00130D748E
IPATSLVVSCRLVSGTLYEFELLEDYAGASAISGVIFSIRKDLAVKSSAVSSIVKNNGDTYYVSSKKPSFIYPYGSKTWTKPSSENCPFYTTSSGKMPAIPLSALPFRAYEAYYNAFSRDIRNNPFIVDGKPEYNKYVPSVKGG